MNKAASAPIPTEAIAAAPGFFRRNAGKLGLAALAGGAGVYGASKLDGSKSTPLPTPAPYASQFADNARDFAQQYGALIPSAVGLGLGGLGGMMNGNPVSGALTGLGTGAGLTAGLAGGNALANTLYGPAAAGAGQPDWKRILTVLAGGGAGAFAGNKITGALTGAHKKNHHDE